MKRYTIIAIILAGCQQQTAEKKPEPKVETEVVDASLTAMSAIQQVHESLEKDCGKDLPNFKDLDELSAPGEEAEKLLEDIGSMAKQCADLNGVTLQTTKDAATCNPDCSWCPIKWYWCIENAGACAGGDNKSCCKLGACGGKHHCEEVCKSSCGCDVPPLPSDGGGDGGDE